jgi:hypothetical protein
MPDHWSSTANPTAFCALRLFLFLHRPGGAWLFYLLQKVPLRPPGPADLLLSATPRRALAGLRLAGLRRRYEGGGGSSTSVPSAAHAPGA